MRFTLEIVPVHIADRGLSATLPKARWERIRQRVAQGYGHRCAACGVTSRKGGPLQCHEVWDYDLATARPPTPDEVEARRAGGEKKTRWDLVGAKARNSVRRGVRRLVGLMPLCAPCHRAKHSDWPCYTFPSLRRRLAARKRDLEPGELLRETLLVSRGQGLESGGVVLLSESPFRSRDRFMELNRGVPLAVLEAHCLEACALRDSRRDVEWASDYNGFDRLDESS